MDCYNQARNRLNHLAQESERLMPSICMSTRSHTMEDDDGSHRIMRATLQAAIYCVGKATSTRERVGDRIEKNDDRWSGKGENRSNEPLDELYSSGH